MLSRQLMLSPAPGWARWRASFVFLCHCARAMTDLPSAPERMKGSRKAAAGRSASAGPPGRPMRLAALRPARCSRRPRGCGQRRLAINVLARFQRRQHDLFVLVRRRGDDHRLDVLVGQDGLVILGRGSARGGTGGAAYGSGVVVANGRQFRLLGIRARVLTISRPQGPRPITATLTLAGAASSLRRPRHWSGQKAPRRPAWSSASPPSRPSESRGGCNREIIFVLVHIQSADRSAARNHRLPVS